MRERESVDSLDVDTIADLMMGKKTVRSVREDYTRDKQPSLIQAKGIRIGPRSENIIDFEVRAGEIVALAGPVGGGKEALAMILAGQRKSRARSVIHADHCLKSDWCPRTGMRVGTWGCWVCAKTW